MMLLVISILIHAMMQQAVAEGQFSSRFSHFSQQFCVFLG
jgi:hypothetical protein